MFATVVQSNAETTTSQALPQLSVKVGTHFKILDVRNIVWVRAAGNYVDVVMADGKTIHSKETISHIAGRLPEEVFVQLHRSFIVNREYVREIQSHQSNYEFTLASGIRLVSSTSYRKRVRSRFLVGLKGGGRSAENFLKSNVAESPPAAFAYRSEKPIAVKTRVRTGARGDEYALAFLGKITFAETYTGIFANEDILLYYASHNDPATYHAWLEDKAAGVWVVETETGNIPVGYMVLTPPRMPFSCARHHGDLEIQRIYLLKSFQGIGLGKRLITQAVQHAQQAGCHRLVLRDYRGNHSTIAFYQHVGFRPIGECLRRVGNHDYNDIVFSLEV